MSGKHKEWFAAGEENGWGLRRVWWSYLPIIRHIVVLYLTFMVERHYTKWDKIGAVRTGGDEWFLYGRWFNLTNRGDTAT